MGVDYSNRVVFGVRVIDIKDEIIKNGIDLEQFFEELSGWEFLEGYNLYEGFTCENTIVGRTVSSNSFGWEELEQFEEPNIDLEELKDCRYYQFIKEIFNKYEPKLYTSLVVW